MCLGCNSRCCRRGLSDATEVFTESGEEVGFSNREGTEWLRALSDAYFAYQEKAREGISHVLEELRRLVGLQSDRFVDGCIDHVESGYEEFQLRHEGRHEDRRTVVRCDTENRGLEILELRGSEVAGRGPEAVDGDRVTDV